MEKAFDVAVIGGGINGCGCAADAAMRGLSVVLLEQDDLASKTSSSSTKLIHGGLRYLEHYEFGLVKKAITERQRLLDLAPHLVHPQALVLPYQKYMRPAWFLRLGLFLYDHLSKKNRLPYCQSVNRNQDPDYFSPLKDGLNCGFLFYDGTADDARLTIVNALQAKNHGASIRTYTKVTQAEVVDGLWHLSVQPQTGSNYQIHAKTLINAAGPWVKIVEQMTQVPDRKKMSLVKGSHIIVPKIYEGQHAYFLQHQDKRMIFIIPYHGFTMIGTTDVPLEDPLDSPHISDEETDYLINLVNSYFKTKINRQDIVYTWSGIRALLTNNEKEARALSRDYEYKFSQIPAPIVTIYGGKITTYRQLAKEAVDQLVAIFPNMRASVTEHSPLPGAVYESMNFEHYVIYAKEKYSWLPPELLHRYLYTYGSCIEQFLCTCTNVLALGEQFGDSLYQIEVDYLIQKEWAQNSDDILKRRTKLDLTMNEISKKKLAIYLKHLAASQPQAEPLLH